MSKFYNYISEYCIYYFFPCIENRDKEENNYYFFPCMRNRNNKEENNYYTLIKSIPSE